jgi:two-component system C4-dicarboxylate transport response regulator DctD
VTEIVYIDDEAPLLRACELVLNSCGLSVTTFEHADEAIAFIRDNEVGIIFCDFRMPRMTGLEVLRAIDKKAPFYLLSGDVQTEEDVGGEPGLTGFLAKPLSFFEVADIAREALGLGEDEG